MFRQIIPDHRRRTLDIRAAVKDEAPPVIQQERIDKVLLGETQVGQDVLWVQMEGRGQDFSHSPGHPDHHVLQRHCFLDMYDVRPLQRLGDLLPVNLGISEAVGIDDRLENRELEMPQGEIWLGAVGIRVAYRHQTGVHAVFPQFPDRIVNGNAQTVSGIICIVANK